MAAYLGLFIILAWAVNAWAFLTVVEARPGLLRLSIWAVVLLIPLFGWLAWFLLGPRPAQS